MNYHIITQEKFFNTYIEDIYRLGLQDENVIWVRGNEGKNVFFQTDRPVEYIGEDRHHFEEKLRQLKPEDNHIVRMWQQCGLEVQNAGDSQALIQLKKQYCDRKDCLRCRIGHEYLMGERKSPLIPPRGCQEDGVKNKES